MLRTLQAILISLLFVVPAVAQDEVGFYFDTGGTTTTTATTAPGEFVQGWLVLKDASALDGIGAWQAEVRVVHDDDTPATVQWLYMDGAQNFATPPVFDVATFTPPPWAQNLVLATALIQVPDPAGEMRVYVAGPRSPTFESGPEFPLYGPEYAHGAAFTPRAMSSPDGSSYLPVATINDDGLMSETASVRVRDYQIGSRLYVADSTMTSPFDLTGLDLVRPLEGTLEVVPGVDLEFRRRPTYPETGDPSPWVTGPVRERFESFASGVVKSYDFRMTTAEPGSLTVSLRFTAGDQVFSWDEDVYVHPTPCFVYGSAEGDSGGSWDNSVVTFGPAVVGAPAVPGLVSVNNFGGETYLLTPQLSGSSSFSLADTSPVLLGADNSGDEYHVFDLFFTPTTTGWHEAVLSFGEGTCRQAVLRGYADHGGVSRVEVVPTATRLLPAHPNPFNPTTTVSFELAKANHTRIAVYGLDGRLVKVLADEPFGAGPAQRTWSGRDTAGRAVASGVYLVRLEAGDVQTSQRITLLK